MSQQSVDLPFYNPLDTTSPRIWPNHTVVLPVCAVGNVGQLACDLIISTLLYRQQCQLVGRIYCPALMAIAGPNAFHSKGPPTSSTEVYQSKELKLVILQFRTSYFRESKKIFVEELTQWIKQSQFDNVLVLSSSFAQCNPDITRIGLDYSIGCINTSLYEPDEKWKGLNLNKIDEGHEEAVSKYGMTYLPGSGITKSLIKKLEKSFIPASFLINFCSEGINIQNCYELANIVDKLHNINTGKQDSWIEPYSWQTSLY